MILTECAHCGAPLPRSGRGRPPRYCSPRHRVAAHRLKHSEPAFPAELTARDRWVRRGPGKRPVTADGAAASSTDPSTWAPHAAVAGGGAPLGFVLNGDGIVCVDLDHCVTDGALAPWAAAILASCPSTYTEVSSSGTGLHIWGYGSVDKGRRIRHADGAHIEVYGTGRYIALGTRHASAPLELADLTEVIDSLL